MVGVATIALGGLAAAFVLGNQQADDCAWGVDATSIAGLAPVPGTEARPALVPVPAGTFGMREWTDWPGLQGVQPVTCVTLSRPLLMATTEVTQGQFRTVMGDQPGHFSACGHGCPVENVRWRQAVAYANRLSEREGLEPCYRLDGAVAWPEGPACEGYRLPTEAEWEFAARAMTRTPWWSGDTEDALADVAHYDLGEQGSTRPVAAGRANPWGLHDVHGNVWEWVWDWHGPYPQGKTTDPAGPPAGTSRAMRGGSYWDDARNARSGCRFWYPPDKRSWDAGFRVVRTARPPR